MTQNQIAYWSLQENQRANRAKEAETYRSNIAKERETNRSNLADELERNRSNIAKEAETHRSNTAQEALTGKRDDRKWILDTTNKFFTLRDVSTKLQSRGKTSRDAIASLIGFK